jgi:Uma2 family endonuclease
MTTALVPKRAPAEPTVHRFTKDEYYRMGGAGLFGDRRVELMGGEIIDMTLIGPMHSAAVTLARQTLDAALSGFHCRDQQSVDASDDSEPQPDLAVVSGGPRDYSGAHPTKPVLVVEVSDGSLQYDRTMKASRYAASGIGEYWIINLPDRKLEVMRGPQPDPAERFGYGYPDVRSLTISDVVQPLVRPEVTIAVADLIP